MKKLWHKKNATTKGGVKTVGTAKSAAKNKKARGTSKDLIFERAIKTAIAQLPQKATRKAFLQNRPVTAIRDNGAIVQIYPDRTEKVIGKVKKVTPKRKIEKIMIMTNT